MSTASPAVAGANIQGARSFAFAFNGSGGASVPKAIDYGGYVLCADADFWIKSALTSTTPVAAVPGNTQPAAGSENATIYVPAGTPFALDIIASGMSIAVLGNSATGGTMKVSGPFAFSTVR
jgi:hypothetical protein